MDEPVPVQLRTMSISARQASAVYGNQTVTTYNPGTLANNTTYYWRIDEKNATAQPPAMSGASQRQLLSGVDRNWTDANDKLWRTAANWSGGVVPTGADKAAIRGTIRRITARTIDSSTTAVANQVVVGDWSSTHDTITMTWRKSYNKQLVHIRLRPLLITAHLPSVAVPLMSMIPARFLCWIQRHRYTKYDRRHN